MPRIGAFAIYCRLQKSFRHTLTSKRDLYRRLVRVINNFAGMTAMVQKRPEGGAPGADGATDGAVEACSSVAELCHYMAGVGGSIPSAPTAQVVPT